jgi:hypothetical protein
MTTAATATVPNPNFVNQYGGPGFSVQGGNVLNAFFVDSAQDNLTANPGGGRANATPIVTQNARITTVATSGDSIILPAAVAGLEVVIAQHGANPCQVFGANSVSGGGAVDTINDVAGTTGVSQMQGSIALYLCFSNSSWYSFDLATGFAGSLETFSTTTGIVAHAGGGQGSATPLPSMNNFVATVATAADSVLLPSAVPGMSIAVFNGAAANAMAVFPQSGQQISGNAVNASTSVTAGTMALFYCGTSGLWTLK